MGFLGDVVSTIGNAVGSVGGFLGDVATGGAISDAKSVQQANETNVNLSREQMAFQERMSNSAYQRAMDDMGKAGLNPMLAFSQGGASTPSGSLGHVDPVNSSAGKMVALAGQKAMDAIKFNADVHQTKAATTLAENQSEDVTQSAYLKSQQKSESEAREANTNQDTQNSIVTRGILKERQRTAAAEADQAEIERDIAKARSGVDKSMAKPDAILERVENAVGAVTGARGVFQRQRPRVTNQYDIIPGSGEIVKHRQTETYEGK